MLVFAVLCVNMCYLLVVLQSMQWVDEKQHAQKTLEVFNFMTFLSIC